VIYCLDVEVVIDINRRYTNNGGRVRDRSGLESALARPMQTWGGQDLYSTAVGKAAALLHGLATTQCFVDGNKRTAWISCTVFLAGMDLYFKPVDNIADEFVVAIAEKRMSQSEAGIWILDNLDM
jgi:death on curing protein